jgi:hypothetical protein
LRGDVGEFAVAFVVEKPVAADGGDKNIRPAVVVVIADGHADAVKANVQSGAGRHIGKVTGAVVAIES